MADVALDILIAELKEMIPTLQERGDFITYYEYYDMSKYEKWLAAAKRFLSLNFPNDKYVLEFEGISKEDITPTQQQRLLAILEAIADMPNLVLDNSKEQIGKGINITTNVNNTNSQTQTQEQSMAVSMFLEAIKDDLTGKQIKELKKVIDESGNDKEKARHSIISKLKSFGSDVASNIVANIITNPMIWTNL